MDWTAIFTNALSAGVGLEAMTFALAALGLNLHFGYTGLLNFGQAAFLAVGAYSVGYAVTRQDLPYLLGLGGGLLLAVVLALLLGVPTLRLRADYLAIVTIAAAEIVRLVVRSSSLRDYFGGSDGINGFAGFFYGLNPYPPNGDYDFSPFPLSFQSAGRAWVLTVGWTVVLLGVLFVAALVRSPWGRVLKAIREDEDAARALGKNIFGYKMQALILGGVLGALGGVMLSTGNASIQPDAFSTQLTFLAYVALLLGGAGRVVGPVLGSCLLWFVLAFTDNVLRQAIDAGYVTFLESTDAGPIRFILVGLSLMLLMIFRPQGILGDRKELAFDV